MQRRHRASEACRWMTWCVLLVGTPAGATGKALCVWAGASASRGDRPSLNSPFPPPTPLEYKKNNNKKNNRERRSNKRTSVEAEQWAPLGKTAGMENLPAAVGTLSQVHGERTLNRGTRTWWARTMNPPETWAVFSHLRHVLWESDWLGIQEKAKRNMFTCNSASCILTEVSSCCLMSYMLSQK